MKSAAKVTGQPIVNLHYSFRCTLYTVKYIAYNHVLYSGIKATASVVLKKTFSKWNWLIEQYSCELHTAVLTAKLWNRKITHIYLITFTLGISPKTTSCWIFWTIIFHSNISNNMLKSLTPCKKDLFNVSNSNVTNFKYHVRNLEHHLRNRAYNVRNFAQHVINLTFCECWPCPPGAGAVPWA